MNQFWETCTKWPQMTLTCSKSIIPICMLHIPPRLKFSSVSVYQEPFLSYGPIFGKVHWMTPKWFVDMFKKVLQQGRKYTFAYNVHPRGPNFHPVHPSTMSCFRGNWDFWIPTGFNVKINLLMTFNEYSKFWNGHFMQTTIRSLKQKFGCKNFKTVAVGLRNFHSHRVAC